MVGEQSTPLNHRYLTRLALVKETFHTFNNRCCILEKDEQLLSSQDLTHTHKMLMS